MGFFEKIRNIFSDEIGYRNNSYHTKGVSDKKIMVPRDNDHLEVLNIGSKTIIMIYGSYSNDNKSKCWIEGNLQDGEWVDAVIMEHTVFQPDKDLWTRPPIKGQIGTYNGGWKNNKFHGYGVLETTDIRALYRKFYDFLKLEPGEKTNLLGDHGSNSGALFLLTKYEGNFIDGIFNGEGKAYYGRRTYDKVITQLLYEGEFQYGVRNGIGKTFYDDGLVQYEGQWLQGNIEGKGVYRLRAGDLLSGNFKKNSFIDKKNNRLLKVIDSPSVSGSGCTIIYEGGIKDGKRNGRGKEYDNGHVIYDGYWLNDKRHGHGSSFRVIDYYDKARSVKEYCGEWVEDKKSGVGTSFFEDGNIAYQGQWQNDSFHGSGVSYNPEKDWGYYGHKLSYSGGYHYGLYHGLGTLYTRQGKFEGEFENHNIVENKGKWIYYLSHVKDFNKDRGFGFILKHTELVAGKTPNLKEDIFFHISDFQGNAEERFSLINGESTRVRFELAYDSTKGPRAVRVSLHKISQ
ncbi:cold shock domain-containing protein [Bacillus sp. 3255]|uniref:cold shock domain-containing protein n=1 Tax=Bacillus sp. 3255 TaxID=2817904 RepID=UPI00285AF187|nr:cold shock domain-containing protein [Bacillus sp. 3255]MDR6883073.1 cold shock CspA family protein [Bacillus sp. 3255]